ncbi:hypothetical protein RclHR1_08720012 [Rhizophagus clarus]|nr:hypothetical protein RclHR1_08720012 [Rhizophagus clarus]GES82580.1 kinase-like domain-containing protein [Rhizophagus clarus]
MSKAIFTDITNTVLTNKSVAEIISRRLAIEAKIKNVPLENVESLEREYSKGTFKRVYKVPDMEYVVQVFKDISDGTLENKIKKGVCCLKTKHAPNTCQKFWPNIKGLRFCSPSSNHRGAKSNLIRDGMKGVKTLHDAWFTHRDLSEVNMMVNITSEYLPAGSENPELVVIDFGGLEFINRDDVLA